MQQTQTRIRNIALSFASGPNEHLESTLQGSVALVLAHSTALAALEFQVLSNGTDGYQGLINALSLMKKGGVYEHGQLMAPFSCRSSAGIWSSGVSSDHPVLEWLARQTRGMFTLRHISHNEDTGSYTGLLILPYGVVREATYRPTRGSAYAKWEELESASSEVQLF